MMKNQLYNYTMIMKKILFILTTTILRFKSYILFNLTNLVYYPINIFIIKPIYDYFNPIYEEFRFIFDELLKIITYTNFMILVLICIFLIAFFKDFYKKHFKVNTGIFKRLNLLWLQRKQITIFIITMVIITYPIRILIRGFILYLFCKHNILVIILAMPFTCYFSNILKKYIFNFPIKKEDYYLFNNYVIKNVNLYNVFSIILIQYLIINYLYYYIFSIIIGIFIVLFILTENNKKFSPYFLLESNTSLSFSFVCCLAIALEQASDNGYILGIEGNKFTLGDKKLTIHNTSFPSIRHAGECLLIKPETSTVPLLVTQGKEAIIKGTEIFPILNMMNQQIESIKTTFEKEILDSKSMEFKDIDLTIQPHSIFYNPIINQIGGFSYIKAHDILIANIYNLDDYMGKCAFNVYPATDYYNSEKLIKDLGHILSPSSVSFIDFKYIITLTDASFTGQPNLIKVPRYINYNHKDPIQITTKEEYYALNDNISNYPMDYAERNEAMTIAQGKIRDNCGREEVAKNIFTMYLHSILGVFSKNFERPGLNVGHYRPQFSCVHKDKPFLIHKHPIALGGQVEDLADMDVFNDIRNILYPRAKRIVNQNLQNGKANYLYVINADEGRMELLYFEKNQKNQKYTVYGIIDITNMGTVSVPTMENTKILKQAYNIFNRADQETLKKFLNLANR